MWHSYVWSPQYRMRPPFVVKCRTAECNTNDCTYRYSVVRPIGARACMSDLVMFWAWLVSLLTVTSAAKSTRNKPISHGIYTSALPQFNTSRQTQTWERRGGWPRFFTQFHSQNIGPSVRCHEVIVITTTCNTTFLRSCQLLPRQNIS